MWFNSKNKILKSLKKIMLFSNCRDFVMEFPGNSLGPLPHLLCFNAGDIFLFSKAQDCFFTDPLFSAPPRDGLQRGRDPTLETHLPQCLHLCHETTKGKYSMTGNRNSFFSQWERLGGFGIIDWTWCQPLRVPLESSQDTGCIVSMAATGTQLLVTGSCRGQKICIALI